MRSRTLTRSRSSTPPCTRRASCSTRSRRTPPSVLRSTAAARPARPRSSEPPAAVFSMLHFVLLLLVVAFRFLGLIAVINFTPTYLVREIEVSQSVASWTTGVYFLGGLIFTPIAGKLCDRWGAFRVLLVTTGLAAPFVFLVGIPSPLWALILYLLPIAQLM